MLISYYNICLCAAVLLCTSANGKTVSEAEAVHKAHEKNSESWQNKANSAVAWGRKPVVHRHDLRTLSAHMDADRLSKALRRLVNRELGVTVMQGTLDALTFDHIPLKLNKLLAEVASEMDATLLKYKQIVERNRDMILRYFDSNPVDMHVFRQYRECCHFDPDQLTYHAQFNTPVNVSSSCDIVSASTSPFQFYPGQNLTKLFASQAGSDPGVRWQYFVAVSGTHVEYPAHVFAQDAPACMQHEPLRHRSQFMQSALPYQKNVVLLIEYGNSLSPAQLDRVKSVACLLLESFSSLDRVLVVAVSDRVRMSCVEGMLLPATAHNRAHMRAFVAQLQHNTGVANHSLGFAESYRVLAEHQATDHNTQAHDYILYVSKGLLSSLMEAGHVLAGIARSAVQHKLHVQINTFPVIDHGKVPLWQFLKDVADQNYSKYESMFDAETRELMKLVTPVQGQMVVVNASETQVLTMGRVLRTLKKPEASAVASYRQLLTLSDVHKDTDGTDQHSHTAQLHPAKPLTFAEHVRRQQLQAKTDSANRWQSSSSSTASCIVSLSMPVWSESDRLIGVVGLDVLMDAVLMPLIHAQLSHANKRLLLVDTKCNVVWYGGWSQSALVHAVSLWQMDNWLEAVPPIICAPNTRSNANTTGHWTVSVRNNNATGNLTYTWHKLMNAPYYVLLAEQVVSGKETYTTKLKKQARYSRIRDCTYHRLDYRVDRQLTSYCLNLKQLANTEKGGIYLSPAAFHQPLRYLLSASPRRTLETGYWAYLSDPNELIQNTGLKSHVKDEVAVLCSLVAHWRKQYDQSTHSSAILRRFIATQGGVMVTLPATVYDQRYEPSNSDWYRKAMEHPGRIVVSAPFLDDSGAGYVVTISHTVYEGKSAAMHMVSDKVVAVLGMHVPVTFLYTLMAEAIPKCHKSGIRCVLLESAGYLVGSMDEAVSSGLNSTQLHSAPLSLVDPVEGQHISHQEPTLAVTLLQQPNIMRKTLCIRHGDQTIQRAFQLNESNTDALSVSGKHPAGCVHLRLIAVPMSNTHLVTVDHNCGQSGQLKAAFCPCNVEGRMCLLCSRVDPVECECPCECNLDTDGQGHGQCVSNRTMSTTANTLSTCTAHSVHLPAPPSSLVGTVQATQARLNPLHEALPQCAHLRHCSQIQQDAVGCASAVGCVWCSRSADGRTPLALPYCAPLHKCFLGVQGNSLTPNTHAQANNIRTQQHIAGYLDESLQIGTPVGPVAGGIMAGFIVMVVAVYCYRHQVTRLVESRTSSSSGARLHLACSDNDLEQEFHFDHGGSKGANCSAQSNAVDTALLASFERDSLPRAVHSSANATVWRPGPRTESSDHGYSTMTDRFAEDSERGTQIGTDRLGANGTGSARSRAQHHRLSMPVGMGTTKLMPVLSTHTDMHTDIGIERAHSVHGSEPLSSCVLSDTEDEALLTTTDNEHDVTLQTVLSSGCAPLPALDKDSLSPMAMPMLVTAQVHHNSD